MDKCKSDPAYFYSYTKRKTRLPPSVGPLAHANGELSSSDEEMANLLSSQYSSVFSIPSEPCTASVTRELFPKEPCLPTDPPAYDPSVPPVPPLLCPQVVISSETIEAVVKKMSNGAAPGPDGIPTLCFKKGGQFITW